MRVDAGSRTSRTWDFFLIGQPPELTQNTPFQSHFQSKNHILIRNDPKNRLTQTT
jgi:hypothetical protein